MADHNPHTRGDTRLCCCGNKCGTCLGTGHWCPRILCSLQRVPHEESETQTSTPSLSVTVRPSSPLPRNDQDPHGEAPESVPGWDGQPGCTLFPSFSEEDVPEVNYHDFDDVLLLFSEEKNEDNTFMAPAQAEKSKRKKSLRLKGGTDNMTTVAYINHQGGLRSQMLHSLARKVILRSTTLLCTG